MAFTASDVKKLRDMTGVGMMDCKKALTEAGGDMDKAIEYLREKDLPQPEKGGPDCSRRSMPHLYIRRRGRRYGRGNIETDFCRKK